MRKEGHATRCRHERRDLVISAGVEADPAREEDGQMGNDARLDLDQQFSARLGRRTLLKGAAALGAAGATAFAPRTIVPARAQDDSKVTFWTTFTDPDLAVLKGMVETYNGQATDHQVELVQIPPAQVTDVSKLMTAVRGGTGPDVYHLDRFIVAQRAADGLLQDLSGLGADAVMENYIDFARAEATFNGKPYALPFDTDARVLYYNKQMIADAGFDPAELDTANGPVTWERIAEIAAALNVKDDSGNYSQMGFVPWANQGWHYTYGFSWGGTFYDAETCAVAPNQQQVVDAFAWVQDYCEGLGPEQVNAFAGPSMQPGFAAQEHPFILGKLAMQITGDWFIAQMAQYAPDMDYGITWMPVPKAGDPSVTWAGGWSVVMPQGAKEPEKAWQFMQWMAGADGQRIYTKESSHLPTWKALLEETDLFGERHKFFAELLPTAKNRPPLPVGAKYWDELTVAWQKTYLDQEEPGDALQTVFDRVQPDLARFCPIG
jgi:multiple sugar transport system substrate-binding protein